MKKEKLYTILVFIVASLIFLAIPALSSPDLKHAGNLWMVPPFRRELLSYILLLLFFYLNYFILTPKLYFNKKFITFGLLLIGIYFFIELVPGFIIQPHFLQGPIHPPLPGPEYHGPPRPRPGLVFELSRHLFLFLLIVIFSIMMRIRDKWKQTQREKLNAELSYLKAQINPHFLFNTLNSIYSLAIDKSDYTATAVVKLSGMMRYVLSEANNEFVSLEKEISYINDYIELQKLRLGNTVDLSYEVTGHIRSEKIAPLVLIPFIENAFKYGVNPEENSGIRIKIALNGGTISLTVKNNKVQTSQDKYAKSGLGIENTKNRLQLLYPSKHFLTIEDTGNEFHVSLSIKL